MGWVWITRGAAQNFNVTTSVPSSVPSRSPNSSTAAPSLVPSSSPSRHDDGMANNHCPAYIEGQYQYTTDTGPFPIPCTNRTFYQWGPPEHQDLACCNEDGRVAVQLAQVGGFDILYNNNTVVPDATNHDYQCVAYTEALRAILCDPRQYLMLHRIQNQTLLRICQSSCDAVFDKCGLPGVNYPVTANYTDGTSLCFAAWGGWNTTPCQANDQQWPCQAIDGLEIINDMDDNGGSNNNNNMNVPCLSIIYPTAETLKAYESTMKPPDACATSSSGISVTTILIVVFVSFLSITLCAVLLLKVFRNRQAAQESEMS